MISRLVYLFPKIIKTYFYGTCLPLRVSHHITHRCDRKCVYCPLWKDKNNELDTDEIKRLMIEFKEKGTISWGFTGGEPMMRDDIDEILEFSKKLGFHVTINTNGFKFEEHLNTLKKIDLVTLSLDGDKKINDFLRGRGSYDQTISALELAKENDINISIFTVISGKNIKDDFHGLKHVFDLSRKLGFKVIPQLIDFYDDMPKDSFDISNKEISGAIEFILNLKDFDEIISTSRHVLDYFKNPKEEKCFAGKFFLVIYPDGQISPCIFKTKKPLSGNIRFDIKKCKCQTNCVREYNSIFNFDIPALINMAREYM